MKDGVPSECVPNTVTHRCMCPFVDHLDQDGSAPHSPPPAAICIDKGKMDGFIQVALMEKELGIYTIERNGQVKSNKMACKNRTDPNCGESAGQGPSREMA